MDTTTAARVLAALGEMERLEAFMQVVASVSGLPRDQMDAHDDVLTALQEAGLLILQGPPHNLWCVADFGRLAAAFAHAGQALVARELSAPSSMQ